MDSMRITLAKDLPMKGIGRSTLKNHYHLPKILVVEDEVLVAQDLKSRLAFMGYPVVGTALDGEQALDIALQTRPELILMDINLGAGMSGIDTAKVIRKELDVPVIYVTANSDEQTIRLAAETDPSGFVLKPFEERALETSIQLGIAKHDMERRLKESEHRFNTTLTSIADGVIATRPDGRIEFMNPSAEKITGWSAADAWGRKLVEVFAISEGGSRSSDTNLFSSVLVGFTPGESKTGLLESRNGATVPIEYRAAHMSHPQASAKGAVISFSDITARHQAEAEIRSTQERLQTTLQSLEHKHEELQNLYHIVSHEVKTPLTSAREFVSLVLEGLAGPVTDTQKEYLQIAQESCDQMRTCINDMLDVTRLETGKMSMEFKPSSVADLVKRIVLMFTPVAEQKEIRLTCTISPEVGSIFMDETRIAQVVSNLLGNALKFTPEGGLVSATVAPAPNRPDSIQIAISDTGRGIAAHHVGRIFDRLYQVRGEDASSRMGLGLGLFICKELTQMHHGDIRVESIEGKGSSFIVTLPVAQKM